MVIVSPHPPSLLNLIVLKNFNTRFFFNNYQIWIFVNILNPPFLSTVPVYPSKQIKFCTSFFFHLKLVEWQLKHLCISESISGVVRYIVTCQRMELLLCDINCFPLSVTIPVSVSPICTIFPTMNIDPRTRSNYHPADKQ